MAKKKQKQRRRRWYLGGLAIIILIFAAAVCMSLTLLGPQVGDVFTNVIDTFETEQVVAESPSEQAEEEDPAPTNTLQSTAITTRQPEFVATSTAIAAANEETSSDSSSISNAELTSTALVQAATAEVATATLLAQATRVAANTEAPVVAPENTADDARLGNADVYPFYDDRLAYPDTMTIELQVILDEWYITPTPFGAITAIPANPDVTRPAVIADPDDDATPRPARLVDELRSVPPFLVAELVCSDVVVVGCTRKPVRTLELQGINTWIWNVQAINETRSQQAMTLRLFRADADGNVLSATPLWQHTFSVQVGATLSLAQRLTQNPVLSIAGGVILLVALLGSVVGYRRYSAGILAGKQPLRGVRVFISYRRKFTWSVARKVNDDLERHGATSFIDVDDIHEGDFSQYIRDNIAQCDYFVVVLAPHTLESKWVIQEIQLARTYNKPVIPVLVDGFDLYADSMPDSVRDLRDDNAVTMNPEYYDAAIQKLVTFMSPDTPSNAG